MPLADQSREHDEMTTAIKFYFLVQTQPCEEIDQILAGLKIWRQPREYIIKNSPVITVQ